jgi:uncharacterized protein (DUF488 family)
MAASGEGVTLYTLGHSRHPIEKFIDLARGHGIDVIVDVRGQPYSRFNPQFNRERFEKSLANGGIGYVWMGDRLSGRPKDPKFRGPDSQVLWNALMRSPGVREGIAEVLDLAGESRLALVCAEENPLTCHRRILLTPPLTEQGAEVLHIRGDGRVEAEASLREIEAAAAGGYQLTLFD